MLRSMFMVLLPISFLCVNSFAQTDTTFYSSSNKVLPDAKNATYYELNNGEGRVGYIEQFYPTGELYGFANYQFNKLNGPYRRYFKNGVEKEKGSYKNNEFKGGRKTYYQNGQEKVYFKHQSRGDMTEVSIVKAFDSLGNQQVDEGNGFYSVLNGSEILLSGEVKNGLKVGEWKAEKDGRLLYREEYKKGKLKKGISFDSDGKEYQYEEIVSQATYPGGFEKWNKYLRENLTYPRDAARKQIQGKVTLSFNVTKHGQIEEILVVESPNTQLTEEAIRVLQNSETWIPAKQRGQPKKSSMGLNIYFKLPG